MALAVPIGMRSSAAMNSSVIPAVTTPSAAQMPNVAQVNAAMRGRTMTRISTPAQTRRNQAAPSTPMRSIKVTAMASPSWTDSIDVIAINAPVRACVALTNALNVTDLACVYAISGPARRACAVAGCGVLTRGTSIGTRRR